MADPSLFDAVRIPASTLIALDNRPFHFALQPFHYVIRLTHLVSMAGFFGVVALLDLKLIGWRGSWPVRGMVFSALRLLHASFGLAMGTGILLFLWDPVHVGAHAYFSPKIIFIVLALANALVFHRASYLRALGAGGALPGAARIAGAVSLVLWTGVVVFSSLNVEGVPKVLLR